MSKAKKLKEIDEKIKLAEVYFQDGAAASSARCLREAADLMDEYNEMLLKEVK